ncbi:unnamed protein product [Heterosigma akashiwo]|mmetsp:Transcript_43210/g.76232  ORF Transcript_43210/g.76232 Transcript_43210/m.76232 type:complete len:126 (-) Transcript_43210:550-927(-)|eukprot:CAMPEP_0194578650 /NCGR_PEP_ID=MMETSP0292-20121207/12983_1 /TAXON_ID=39354 /ORGANISM="Heterosigma akashiwo, Strain CCMP2393" /LENGTH=125 /DNA_ID=CAMNT_0039431347 /DNA_START=41 /DNA_END=418 /DNA_ORIENTATION=-
MGDSDDEGVQQKYEITRKITWLKADIKDFREPLGDGEPRTLERPVKYGVEEIKNDLVEQVDKAMNENSIEKDIATKLKRFFDEKYGGTWHAVVGHHFGCSVTNETSHLLFMKLDQMFVLCFKSME